MKEKARMNIPTNTKAQWHPVVLTLFEGGLSQEDFCVLLLAQQPFGKEALQHQSYKYNQTDRETAVRQATSHALYWR